MSLSLTELIQAVDEADSSDALLDAVEDLAAACEEGAIPTLIATLSFNNPGAAVAAVEGLIQLGTASVVPLMELLDLDNYTARSWAVRALAGIGDPRGFITLLEAATTDFAMSVRRAAVRGLGSIQWDWFPNDLCNIAQQEALSALILVAQKDEEWVVRYAAVVGLQSLAWTVTETIGDGRLQIDQQLAYLTRTDTSPTVQARAHWAIQQLTTANPPPRAPQPSPLATSDWQVITEQLHQRKKKSTLPGTTVL